MEAESSKQQTGLLDKLKELPVGPRFYQVLNDDFGVDAKCFKNFETKEKFIKWVESELIPRREISEGNFKALKDDLIKVCNHMPGGDTNPVLDGYADTFFLDCFSQQSEIPQGPALQDQKIREEAKIPISGTDESAKRRGVIPMFSDLADMVLLSTKQ